jgi:hypothetical protein
VRDKKRGLRRERIDRVDPTPSLCVCVFSFFCLPFFVSVKARLFFGRCCAGKVVWWWSKVALSTLGRAAAVFHCLFFFLLCVGAPPPSFLPPTLSRASFEVSHIVTRSTVTSVAGRGVEKRGSEKNRATMWHAERWPAPRSTSANRRLPQCAQRNTRECSVTRPRDLDTKRLARFIKIQRAIPQTHSRPNPLRRQP